MPSKPDDLLSYLRVVLGAWRNDPRDDDELLVRFVQDSDGEAFKVLVWRYGLLVWRSCTRVLGEGPDAEDAFQVAFLALARKAGRLPIKNVAGWLHQVARQAALNAKAGVRRRQSLEQRLQVVTQLPVEESAGRTELYAALDEELADLPDKLRATLLLHYLEGKPQVEVACLLGCSRGVVQRRLARGEAILRKRLERRGLEVGTMAALLTSSVAVSAVPARLIGSTAQAAVAFRSGTLASGTAEMVRTIVRSLPIEGAVMRKIGWMALACVGFLGAGLAAWQAPLGRPDEVESSAPALPKMAAGTNSKQVDRDGDPLTPGVLVRLGTLRLRHVGSFAHRGGAESAVFSRDGKVLITAGAANPIQLWDTATGKLLRSFGSDNRPNSAVSIVLSPDGNNLAARSENGNVSLWKVATGKLLHQLGSDNPKPETNILALAFSQDGRTLLSAGEDNHLRVWEVVTGKQLRDQPLRNAKNTADPSTSLFFFSPNGKILVSIHNVKDNNTVSLWESATGQELYRLSLGKGEIPRAAAFSPDSRFLAVSRYTMTDNNPSGEMLHLWEVATGKEMRKWTPDKAGARSAVFSPDGKLLATASGFGPIRLWEVATGKELRQCQDYQAHVVALAFSPDGSTLASLAGIHDHTARLWEVASGKERTPPCRGHVGPVVSVSFSSDEKSVISGGRDGLVGLWNAETGQERRPPLRTGDFQALAALSADGKTFLTISNRFSPNGQSLYKVATQTPTQICVWDTVICISCTNSQALITPLPFLSSFTTVLRNRVRTHYHLAGIPTQITWQSRAGLTWTGKESSIARPLCGSPISRTGPATPSWSANDLPRRTSAGVCGPMPAYIQLAAWRTRLDFLPTVTATYVPRLCITSAPGL